MVVDKVSAPRTSLTWVAEASALDTGSEKSLFDISVVG
jgi:hypothetical protein